MLTFLIPLAAWILALKMANDGDDHEPLVLGAIAGSVFAACAWIDVAFFGGSAARAAVATPLYVGAGAVFVKLFSRVEGALAGAAVVVLSTGVMFFGVSRLSAAVVPLQPAGGSPGASSKASPAPPEALAYFSGGGWNCGSPAAARKNAQTSARSA